MPLIPCPTWRAILLIVVMAVGGCHARRPDFMTRVREDCAAGQKWACDLIDAMSKPPSMDDTKTPLSVVNHPD
jgi:hypothetical protein